MPRRAAACCLIAAAALNAGATAPARAQTACGEVCIHAKPNFQGRKVCYRAPVRVPNIPVAWGAGFVPGSVRVSGTPGCAPIAYFFGQPDYAGAVGAYFSYAKDISARRYQSFRLRFSRRRR